MEYTDRSPTQSPVRAKRRIRNDDSSSHASSHASSRASSSVNNMIRVFQDITSPSKASTKNDDDSNGDDGDYEPYSDDDEYHEDGDVIDLNEPDMFIAIHEHIIESIDKKVDDDQLDDSAAADSTATPTTTTTTTPVSSTSFFNPPHISATERNRLISKRSHVYVDKKDLNENYNDTCYEILISQKEYYEWLSNIPTNKKYKYKSGKAKKAFTTPVSVPLYREGGSEEGNMLLVVFNYCPDNLRNGMEAKADGSGKVYRNNNGKNRHVAEWMHSHDDKMVAGSIEVVRAGFGTKLWLQKCIMMEMCPASHPYGGSMGDVYDEDHLEKVMEKYAKEVFIPTIKKAIESNGRIKVFFVSTGVTEKAIEILGGNRAFKNLRDKHPNTFINIADDPDKNFETSTHPETLTSKIIRGNVAFPSRCVKLSKVITHGLQHLTGDDTIVSNVGEQLLNNIEGSPGHEALVAAEKAFHERHRARWRDNDSGLQKYVLEKCKAMGIEGVDENDPVDGLMKYMTELWKHGTSPLQKHYEKLSHQLGINLEGTEVECFISFYFFHIHWSKFQELIGNKNNYYTMADGTNVFFIKQQQYPTLYGYYNDNILRNAKNGNTEDWRVKKFVDAGVDIDGMTKYNEGMLEKRDEELEKKQKKKDKLKKQQQELDEEHDDLEEDGNNDMDLLSLLRASERK